MLHKCVGFVQIVGDPTGELYSARVLVHTLPYATLATEFLKGTDLKISVQGSEFSSTDVSYTEFCIQQPNIGLRYTAC